VARRARRSGRRIGTDRFSESDARPSNASARGCHGLWTHCRRELAELGDPAAERNPGPSGSNFFAPAITGLKTRKERPGVAPHPASTASERVVRKIGSTRVSQNQPRLPRAVDEGVLYKKRRPTIRTRLLHSIPEVAEASRIPRRRSGSRSFSAPRFRRHFGLSARKVANSGRKRRRHRCADSDREA